jgi:hypothetical protein
MEIYLKDVLRKVKLQKSSFNILIEKLNTEMEVILKKSNRVWWFTHAIPATWEVETRRIMAQDQPGKKC